MKPRNSKNESGYIIVGHPVLLFTRSFQRNISSIGPGMVYGWVRVGCIDVQPTLNEIMKIIIFPTKEITKKSVQNALKYVIK